MSSLIFILCGCSWLRFVPFFSGVCFFLQARSQFKSRSTANNVSILVPVPSDADTPRFKTSTGHAKWVPEKSAVEWTIKSFPVSDAFTSLQRTAHRPAVMAS